MSLRKSWILAVLSALMLFSGCQKAETKGEDPAVIGGQNAAENSDEQEINGKEETEKPLEKPKEEAPSEPSKTEKKEPFSGKEVVSLFRYTEKEIIALYGKPDVRRETDYGDRVDGAAELRYGETLFEFEYVSNPDGQLALVVIADNKIAAPRSLKIGDSKESVLACFPLEKEGKEIAMENDRKMKMLYGNPEEGSAYAAAEYAGEDLFALRFYDTGVLFSIEFADGKASRFSYTLALA